MGVFLWVSLKKHTKTHVRERTHARARTRTRTRTRTRKTMVTALWLMSKRDQKQTNHFSFFSKSAHLEVALLVGCIRAAVNLGDQKTSLRRRSIRYVTLGTYHAIPSGVKKALTGCSLPHEGSSAVRVVGYKMSDVKARNLRMGFSVHFVVLLRLGTPKAVVFLFGFASPPKKKTGTLEKKDRSSSKILGLPSKPTPRRTERANRTSRFEASCPKLQT